MDTEPKVRYALILPNHETITYYRWDTLAKTKQDAQKVADGWHEYVEVVEIDEHGKLKLECTVKPKTKISQVPVYHTYGNRTWDMEWKEDTPKRW